ncbi:MAG: aspartate/glutamate racemase family protein [Acidimicrobiia bacterium]|jgi:Asp/Glu/hydantoin racemase
MTGPIVVINPNSTERITRQIRDAVSVLGGNLTVVTSPGGPPAIESDAEVAASVLPLLATAEAHGRAAAYVVACFSDPGLDELRRGRDAPSFGIAESALGAAISMAEQVGIVSSVEDSIPRHQRYWKRLGIEERVVADIAVGLGVLDLETEDAYERVEEAGESLVRAGAGAVVLGCTGMTHMAERLQARLGVPVIDPCRAAVAAAMRAVIDPTAGGP